MYQSKNPIQAKLSELRVLRTRLDEFRGRVLVRFGLDEASGTYPLRIALSNFLAHSRSVIQYAHKEAGQRGLLERYNGAVRERPLFKLFKDLRDADIHAYPVNVATQIHISATLARQDALTDEERSAPAATLEVTSLDQLATPSPAHSANVRIEHHVSVQVPLTPEVLDAIRKQGDPAATAAAEAGEPVHLLLEHEGERDLFKLIDRYFDEIESFVELGTGAGFIS